MTFSSVLHFFNVLMFLDLTLAILCCILIIKLPLRYGIKFATIPLIMLVTVLLVVKGEDVLGRPYNSNPVGQFEFVDYRVVKENGIKKIELWVIQEGKSRLHIVTHTAKREQNLAKAKTNKNKGRPQSGEFQGHGDRNADLSIGDIPVDQILPPKDEEPEPEPDKPTLGELLNK